MNVKNIVCFEVQKEERIYRLDVPSGASLGEVYLVVGEMMDEVVRLINEHAEKRKEQEKDNAEAE